MERAQRMVLICIVVVAIVGTTRSSAQTSGKAFDDAAAKQVQSLALRLGLDPAQVISFSAVTGAGRDELAEAVMSLVSAEPSEADEG